MPIDEFQQALFRLLAKNRNPNSFVAGGPAMPDPKEISKYTKHFGKEGGSWARATK